MINISSVSGLEPDVRLSLTDEEDYYFGFS